MIYKNIQYQRKKILIHSGRLKREVICIGMDKNPHFFRGSQFRKKMINPAVLKWMFYNDDHIITTYSLIQHGRIPFSTAVQHGGITPSHSAGYCICYGNSLWPR